MRAAVAAILATLAVHSCDALRATARALPRRLLLAGAAPMLVSPPALAAPIVAPGFEPERVQGIGGGADVLSEAPPAVADVVYPPFLNGTWRCERVVTSIEGDSPQAEGAWKLLGGSGSVRSPESYAVRFTPQPTGGSQSLVGIDGRRYFGVIFDRGFELSGRLRPGSRVSWDPRAPDVLEYERAEGGRGAAAELRVIQRSTELPGDANAKGWGSNELVRIATTTIGDLRIYYACRVQRRWRRGVTEAGERVVEGLEIVKTYRVLDGVAGVEFPTSTTKSLLRLTRV